MDIPADELEDGIATFYRQLPLATREWLATMNEKKIARVERTIRAQEMADAFGWGAKWLFIAIVTIFGGIGTVIYGWNLLIEKITSKVATP